jgi:hypothetical protein
MAGSIDPNDKFYAGKSHLAPRGPSPALAGYEVKQQANKVKSYTERFWNLIASIFNSKFYAAQEGQKKLHKISVQPEAGKATEWRSEYIQSVSPLLRFLDIAPEKVNKLCTHLAIAFAVEKQLDSDRTKQVGAQTQEALELHCNEFGLEKGSITFNQAFSYGQYLQEQIKKDPRHENKNNIRNALNDLHDKIEKGRSSWRNLFAHAETQDMKDGKQRLKGIFEAFLEKADYQLGLT